jgi:hypothetical protein
MTVVEILDAKGATKKIDVVESGEGLVQLVNDPTAEERLEAIRLLLSAPLIVADGGGSVTVDDGGASLTVDGTVALGSGSAAIGKLAANAGVNIGSIGLLPQTTGGLEIKRVLAAASTNATSVKASTGQLFGYYIFNASASTKYVKLYNKASAPTVGTDTPVITLPIPKEAGANVEFVNGIAFATGIALAITGALADADTTAVVANDVVANLFYR